MPEWQLLARARPPHLQQFSDSFAILQVPQHPNTWFKVQAPDGRVIKFQQTAMQLAGDQAAAADSAPQGLVAGAKVVVRDTASTQERCPNYIGNKGA